MSGVCAAFARASLFAVGIFSTVPVVLAGEEAPAKVFAGEQARQRFGSDLIESLPEKARLPKSGMPIVVLTTQDLLAVHKGRLPGITSTLGDDDWKPVERTFHGLLKSLLPAEAVTKLTDNQLSDKERQTLLTPLQNLVSPHETSTVVNLGRDVCIIVMGDGSETAGQLAASFAGVSTQQLPVLQNLATLEQYKWLLVHEARHCGQMFKQVTGFQYRNGNEADADSVANQAFPNVAPLALRQRALVGLHSVKPEHDDPKYELQRLNVHATTLSLLTNPSDPYALDSKTVANAYRHLGTIITRELFRSGDIEPMADIWIEIIDEALAGKNDIKVSEVSRADFMAGREILRQHGDKGFRLLIGSVDTPLKPLEALLVWHHTGNDGALNRPELNAPVLSNYLSSNADIPPLARAAGLLYLRAAADLDPALEKYALPMPPGLSFPPLPQPEKENRPQPGVTSLHRKTATGAPAVAV